MTTTEVEKTHTTGDKGTTSSYSFDAVFYFELAVIFIGIVGIAGNALVLYALVASKQNKKHLLIVNQNVLDLASCLFLVLLYSLRLCNLHLSGVLGYWLCKILLSECLLWCGTIGSIINLAIITVDRYLKVIHPNWSKKYMRSWLIYCVMALPWVLSTVYNITTAFLTTEFGNGECYGYSVFASEWHLRGYVIWYVLSFYVIILAIFVFCYGRILAAIRRQASVMAVHDGPGSNAIPAQSNQIQSIQSNVIKTMILISAFYAIAWLPANVYFSLGIFDPSLTLIDARYYVCMFVAFVYNSANPFIYATKFVAVRKVLVAMIPCRKNPV